MSKEGQPLQVDLFTRELVDNRTRSQKQSDRNGELPEQAEMFRQRDIAQFGVRSSPQFSLSPTTRLVLIAEDPRTPEEIERDLERQAQALTYSLFNTEEVPPPASQPDRPLFPAGAVIFQADQTHETNNYTIFPNHLRVKHPGILCGVGAERRR